MTGAWILRALNMADALLTLLAVLSGIATEANPLMAAAIRVSPWFFVGVKIVIVEMCLWIDFRFGSARLLPWMVGLYVAVVGWNVIGLVLA